MVFTSDEFQRIFFRLCYQYNYFQMIPVKTDQIHITRELETYKYLLFLCRSVWVNVCDMRTVPPTSLKSFICAVMAKHDTIIFICSTLFSIF